MSLEAYHAHIARKRVEAQPSGLTHVPALHSALKPHQVHCVEFALRAGRAGHFLDTGLGKSFAGLEWGRVVVEATNRPVLMLAPLAVGPQHAREAERWGIDAGYRREPNSADRARIVITNYERLDRFDLDAFGGVVLDEASIIKNFTGATTRRLIEAFARTPFRLSATATPAPNDHMELGQQAQFLGVMDSNEMLTRWFVTDHREMGRYRLKRAAVRPFWEWVSSWARCVAKPSDLGFSDEGYALPELRTARHTIRVDRAEAAGEERDGQGRLFRMPDLSATSLHREKRLTAEARAARVAEIVAREADEPWIVWCDTDYEADALAAALPGAVEVRGSMSADVKEERLDAFSRGAVRHLISKPSVAGFGLNWQHCARVAFVGLSFSYESYYQAVRRCWRFGQTRPVDVHVVAADTEGAIGAVVARKAADHDAMKREMTAAMARASRASAVLEDYRPSLKSTLPAWMVSA
ncbi:DEAD/DEAH box helicase [Methylorubrum sp. SB2]|uniref:DEAD/DEAH box helicase n=1 Tax=Methylorubrum subtropicum TaxID=3138812 RepID=UPI00313DDAAE